jgi:small-conductance mechanosensitive channel
MNVLTAPWFYWSVIIAVALPVVLVLLTELQIALSRRGSFLARPIGLLRSFIVPLGALLLLLTQTTNISFETTGIRLIATLLGFFILVMALSGVSGTVFANAPSGSWRRRMPSIFIDVARFAIIAVGLAIILAYVWGANVGGLFTALGVSSIVLGLTLQNSVGQIISGLLLLFEQPFQMGDWVETTAARGRVVEVNWRATHINTGSGLEIIPNSVLAGQAFTNLSRPAGGHTITVNAKFTGSDAPDEVCALLAEVAANLPHLHPDGHPVANAVTSTDYTVTIPVRSPADDTVARTTFQRWLWYGARRSEIGRASCRDRV